MMELSGKILSVTLDYETHKPILTLLIEEDPRGIEKLLGDILAITIGKKRKKRSLDANAYFHVLCQRLATISGVTLAEQKNDLITSWGQPELIDGYPMTYKTNAPPEYMAKREEVHMKFIRMGEDGAFWYRMYRGSHTYNSAEMARLIDGTVSECKNVGIETATPEEIAKMNALWERKRHDQAG